MGSDLQALRQTTKDLIDNWPTSIVLQRENTVRVYGGSRDGAPTDQTAKNRYLTPLNRVNNIPDTGRTSQLGEGWLITHLLLGLYDDDIVQDDQFVVDGVTYRIVDVERRGDYETRALCATEQITHD